MHRPHTTASLAALALAGCYIARDASTLVVVNAAKGNGSTNSATASPISVVASPHQSATLPTHVVLWTLAGVAVVALVAGVLWVIHNRAYLLGQLTKVVAST